MRMRIRVGVGALALSTVTLICSNGGMAQEADLQAQVEDLQQRYEQAIAAQDWAAMGSLFTQDATFLPITGGQLEGAEGISVYHEQSGITALDATSSHTERLGENLILDVGTFTATATSEAGDMPLEGEYLVLTEMGEDGLRMHRAVAFPTRQPPGAPAGP